MKYLLQSLWILLFSFLGECLHLLLPIPVPASIYGMLLLFAALAAKLIRPEQIRESGHFLVDIMGVLFVSPMVGLLDCRELLRANAAAITAVTVLVLIVTFGVSGRLTQRLLKKEEQDHD